MLVFLLGKTLLKVMHPLSITLILQDPRLLPLLLACPLPILSLQKRNKRVKPTRVIMISLLLVCPHPTLNLQKRRKPQHVKQSWSVRV